MSYRLLSYVLDLWFEKIVKRQLTGYTRLICYGDDFIVCFQRGDEDRAFEEILRQRLGKVGLKIAEG